MTESNQISRKRMRFSSYSASEILATSKPQYQRHRFGRIESHTGDGLRFNNSPSVTGKITPKVLRTYPRVTIKDLRLRRVFTPSSICEFKTKEQIEKYPCDSNVGKEGTKADAGGLGNARAEDFLKTTPLDSVSGPTTCEEINGTVVKKTGANVCNKPVLRPCSRAKIFKNPGSFSYKRLLPYLMQAADGTASGLCSKPEQNLSNVNQGNGEVTEEEASEMVKDECQLPEPTKDVAQSVDGLISKYFGSGSTIPLKKVESTKAVAQSVDVIINEHSAGSGNTSPFKMVEPTKVVPQSVDGVISKHSAGSGNTSPLNKVIASSPNKKTAFSRRKLFKTPGSVNYRRMLPYLKDIQEDNPCVLETANHPDHKKNTGENTPSPMLVSENEGAEDIVTSNVARESDTCSDEDKELIPCEAVSESPEGSDTDKEQETQVKHVITDTEKNLGTPQNDLGSKVQFSSPIAGSTSSSEVALSALNNIYVENLAGEELVKTDAKNKAEQVEANSSDLTAELLDPSAVSGTPTSISPSKGILKRSIRGCRGICSCLNCSSFRLNAERAFEFSRNQLQDTEAGDAAKRASEAADLAKSRLYQMNNDLQVHCRIPNEQRARVKFAHYVHEKTILEASQPTQLDP
ncbi:unnamed protein product [Eruca vesicaria subsp. sativa]|uniref:Uncharacterized protein n=1 Tax=Eruca vesicaria subsp. sativa TaxID=29727 RepID=A0ABC8KXX3_ERUVS|nr:unnamed protein product [Eruca vesicaria subsp. sativa]